MDLPHAQDPNIFPVFNKYSKNSSLVTMKLSTSRRGSLGTSYGVNQHFSQMEPSNCLGKPSFNHPSSLKILNNQDDIHNPSNGRYSPHPNEIFIHPTKLSIPPHYDDSVSCHLPPPSPAPNSDRVTLDGEKPHSASSSNQFELSKKNSCNTLMITSSLNKNVPHLSSSSSISSNLTPLPNSNSILCKKNSMMTSQYSQQSSRLESCKDHNLQRVEYKCSKFLPFSTPLITNDNYNNYICSTVHTPVKRYVPTPPPSANEIYTHHINQQQVGNATYRVQMKCCTERQQAQSQKSSNVQTLNSLNLDHLNIATSSQINRNSLNNSSQNSSETQCSSSVMIIDHNKHKKVDLPDIQNGITTTAASTPTQSMIKPSNSSHTFSYVNSYVISNNSKENSIEECNQHKLVEKECDIKTFQNIKNPYQEISNRNYDYNNGTAACLHCNNVRRKTGVHRTTQTTGPISPTPLPPQTLTNVENIYSYCPKGYEKKSSMSDTNRSPSPSSALNSHNKEQQQQTNQIIISSRSQNNPSGQQALNNQYVCEEKKELHSQQKPAQNSNRSFNPDFNIASPQNTSSQSQSQTQRTTRKKRFSHYLSSKISRFFGVEIYKESEDFILWKGRQRRFAMRRFGGLKVEAEIHSNLYGDNDNVPHQAHFYYHASERPDILPENDSKEKSSANNITNRRMSVNTQFNSLGESQVFEVVERKPSVISLMASIVPYLLKAVSNSINERNHKQWSRSFAPYYFSDESYLNQEENIQQDHSEVKRELNSEVFFDCPAAANNSLENLNETGDKGEVVSINSYTRPGENRQNFLGERLQGWRTSGLTNRNNPRFSTSQNQHGNNSESNVGNRGARISPQLLDGVLENSRRPLPKKIKLFTINALDDRFDHRPFFTYWINTVQIIVLILSIMCYGIGPVGIGFEQKTGQVLVTSLSLQTVQHIEKQNMWIGPRNNDLVHLGGKFAICMRPDNKISDVLLKTRRQERDTACCIRNDDSGCVQSSQADCSVRGLFPTKSISTWKKWSPGDSGPGGRISGSVCGLDPKFCDAPASIAPYEWPDDITKWPICRKTNSVAQRFRFKDHTAEHMVCEVIGHPCCIGVFGDCRITTREYCEFINGYFHEEASLCSQISCLNNVCGMVPFMTPNIPDQIYRVITSLCLHAGIFHLAVTLMIQHIILADLERFIGSIRAGLIYICSGVAGNLASAVLAPYKAEVGPSASLCGILGSCTVLLFVCHWTYLQKPHFALIKILLIGALLFALGTLPWQLNFVGLSVGILSGAILTISSIPFISIGKYNRKSKINSIWTCFIFHAIFFSILLTIFYVFPTELKNFKMGDILAHEFDPASAFENRFNSPEVTYTNFDPSEQITFQQTSGRQKIYRHHHSDDIISNSASLIENDSRTLS